MLDIVEDLRLLAGSANQTLSNLALIYLQDQLHQKND